jgi:hypothetical protein
VSALDAELARVVLAAIRDDASLRAELQTIVGVGRRAARGPEDVADSDRGGGEVGLLRGRGQDARPPRPARPPPSRAPPLCLGRLG